MFALQNAKFPPLAQQVSVSRAFITIENTQNRNHAKSLGSSYVYNESQQFEVSRVCCHQGYRT